MSVQCHFHFYYFSSCFVFDFFVFLFLLLALGTHGGRRRALSLPLPSIKAPPRRFFAFFFFLAARAFRTRGALPPDAFFFVVRARARSGAPPTKTPIKTHGRRGDCWAPPPRARALARDATRRTAATKFKRVCYFSLFIRREGRAKSARGAERRGAPNGRARVPGFVRGF